MASALLQKRRALFSEWKGADDEPTSLLGAGKYGNVYRTALPQTVVKQTQNRKTSAQQQAFMEHAVGILQTLLVLKGYTPHLAIHFGTQIEVSRGLMRGRMYMEKCAGSLQDLGQAILKNSEDWVSLTFQIVHALAVLAEFLELTHNDLYPRNVLIQDHAQDNLEAHYMVRQKMFTVPWPFLVVLTDFGIASSATLMNQDSAPPITRRIISHDPGEHFGAQPPFKHILCYRVLPPFSRDLYALLKWCSFPTNSLPLAPDRVIEWAKEGLRILDSQRKQFDRASSVAGFLLHFFSRDTLYNAELPLLKEKADVRVDFYHDPSPARRATLLKEGAKILESICTNASAKARSQTVDFANTSFAKELRDDGQQ